MATWGKFSPIPHPWTNLEVSSNSISLMLSYPIFILANIKIFLESKNTGGIRRQNMHLSIQNA